MWLRGVNLLMRAVSGCLPQSLVAALSLLGLLSFTISCGSQDPSFVESKSVQRLPTDSDAIANVDQPGAVDAGDETSGNTDSGTESSDGSGNTSGSTGGGSTGGSDGVPTSSDGGGTNGSGGTTSGGDTGGTSGGGDTGGTSGGGDTGGTSGGGDTGGTGGIPGGENLLPEDFRSQTLIQDGPGKVDILWVVDTSGSMAEEQNYLAQNFASLITKLSNAGHDFQTAVTTTDICQDYIPSDLTLRVCPVPYYGENPATHLRGRFIGQPGQQILKQGDPNLISKFTSFVSLGTNGSPFEHGLKAADMAIDKVLNGTNDNLIRSDAFLAVIVVSDEEDDGIGLAMLDGEYYRNFWAEGRTRFRFTDDDMIAKLQQVKGTGNFSISAIAPTRKANGQLCSAPHSAPKEEGTQYIKAAQKTGGILQSICATNWDNSLANIGLDLNAQLTQVVLNEVPYQPSIHVYVNGVESTQWTYNAGNNAVKFNTGYVPAAGAEIKVTYYKL